MKGVFLIVVLFATVAQVFPSCQGQGGEGPKIVGWVQEKRIHRRSGEFEYEVVIDHTPYTVPYVFWREVKVGDLVKYDGFQWTIVGKAGETSIPTSP